MDSQGQIKHTSSGEKEKYYEEGGEDGNIAAYDDDYKIQGNALIVNNKVYHKEGIVLSIKSEVMKGRIKYYVIDVANGEHTTYLRYGTKELANQHLETLTDYLSI